MESRMGGDSMRLVLIHISLLFLLLPSCEKGLDFPSSYEEVDLEHRQLPDDRFAKVDSTEWIYNLPTEDSVTHIGIEAVKRRALQMATITWRPNTYNIPSRYGVYSPGKSYTGIPYSLAIITDSYVGTQSSLYTFMTALDNPGSVLYTEDLRKPPYNGFDCAPYYGTTCSNSVMYALGVEPPFYTYMIPAIPGMIRPKAQSPNDVEPCDILLRNGHVVMVFDVQRDVDDQIQKVRVFETTSDNKKDTWIRDFNQQEFKNWWGKGSYVRYQYTFLNDVTDSSLSIIPNADEPSISNYRPLEVCTTLGDCVTYWRGQEVAINSVARGFKTLVVFKDEEFYSEVPIRYPKTVLPNLPCGQYKVRLSDAEGYYCSLYTRFEVIDAQVSGTKEEQTIKIAYSSTQASPRYVCICNETHDPYGYYIFSDSDRERGYYEMPAVKGDRSSHYKVYFKGKYNTISTELKTF